jgi:hypothetical protein
MKVRNFAACLLLVALAPTVHLSAANQSASMVTLRENMRKLWTDHTVWTRDYIIATVGNQPDQDAAAARLMKNQEDMMKMHLSTTTTEVVARLNKNWAADAVAWDAVYNHILKMSDALSDGIIKQYPDKFRT